MKKILCTAVMLVSFTAISKAQQKSVGINTAAPASTLDVSANASDATVADALLVPRMTAAELNAKNAVYNTAQNGALVFVTSGTGTAATKTQNVTGAGFYYYNTITSLWTAMASSSPALNVTNQTGGYTALPTDDIILFTTSGPTTLTLPTTGVAVGKKLYVSVVGNSNISVTPPLRETATQALIVGQGNTLVYTGISSTPWSLMTGY